MKRMQQVVLGILLIGILGCFSCKKYPAETTSQITANVTPLNGEQTAQRIAKLYNELGPRIGVHLVEPNVVITIAGLRGSGNFLMHDLTNEEKLKLEKINEVTKEFGVKFVVHDDPEDEIADIGILNLNGLEYSSKLSKLPFVIPFDSSTGEKGYDTWFREVINKAGEYFGDKGMSASGQQYLFHLMIGLILGYPDQALLDAYNVGDEHSKLTYSNILYSDYYESPQPNFGYLSEHADEVSIVNIKKSWGTLLEEFYNSSWHKSIAKDPVFIKAVESERKVHDDWFVRKRLNE